MMTTVVSDVSENDVVNYANNLLSKCNIDFTIEASSECSSDLFLAFYHAILGDFPAGALTDCSSVEAQIHNVKCIVDTLSTDYLRVDLSHIEPEEVVKGELLSVYNLLEILDGLLDYLLEKIGIESDSGDEGDVDSDQLSEQARVMALETIQREMARADELPCEQSLSSTAELIALGRASSVTDRSLQSEDFVPLQGEISLTPEISNHQDEDGPAEISDHTLHSSGMQHPGSERRALADITPLLSDADSYKDLPPPSRDVSDMLNSFSQMQMSSDSFRPSTMQEKLHIQRAVTPPSPPGSSIVVSDSGASLDSERQKLALDVKLDDEHASFVLKEKATLSGQDSSASESVDVADGRGQTLQESDDNLRPRKKRPTSPLSQPPPRAKDWQAMLDNLQKTVEESRRIRQQYFSTGGIRSGAGESSEDILSSLADESGTTDEPTTSPILKRSPGRRKNVRFEDTISTNTAKELKDFQKLLQKEKELQEEKNLILSRNYQDHLDEVEEAEHEKLGPMRRRVKDGEKEVKQTLQTQKKTRKQRKGRHRANLTDAAKWKSWLSPGKPRRSPARQPKSGKKPEMSSSGIESINEYDLLPKLLEEFPHLELPAATLNDMWHKQFRQIEQLTAAAADHKNKKRKSEMQLQEAHHKHELLLDIMQKEHDHTRHMRDVRERAAGQKEAQRTLRDRRQQTARIRRYYRDYHVQMRSRMLKRRTKEERIFKRLFEDGLSIQRARLRELRKYARDKREEQQKRQLNEIQSLENYYRDQFNILAETLENERSDLKIRDAAQIKLVRQMKRGLRQKMENEISELQEMIARDDEDAYFREIEADRLRRQLQLATYHAKFKD